MTAKSAARNYECTVGRKGKKLNNARRNEALRWKCTGDQIHAMKCLTNQWAIEEHRTDYRTERENLSMHWNEFSERFNGASVFKTRRK